MTNTQQKFASIEHEVLYESLNSNDMTEKSKFDGIISFEKSIVYLIEKLNNFSTNNGDFQIIYPKKKCFKYIFIFLKSFIRKFLRWYINPIIERQNIYNSIVVDILKIMNKNINELKNEITNLHQRNL